MNPYKEIKDDGSFAVTPIVSYEDIATKLLKDNYFLTALELHTELVESGKELPQLREFFSNPGNFEQHVSRASEFESMHRSASQGTLDSLDTTRYSEDGGGDRGDSGGDVAILEFELRKAKETINALRANLTQFADGESALNKSSKEKNPQRSLKPHEKRALNFLVNEYLLLNDYKLTSITFSDENPDQDFEDWDDVGLNKPRPSGLTSLFLGTSKTVPTADAGVQAGSELQANGSQTDVTNEGAGNFDAVVQADNDWSHELLVQAEEINLLKLKISELETDKLNFQKLYDAAIISLNALTTPVSEGKTLDLKIPNEKLSVVQRNEQVLNELPLTCTASENHYGSVTSSSHCVSPDQFEIIENEKAAYLNKKEGSITSSFDPVTLNESTRNSPLRRSSITTLDETLSINDAADWKVYDYGSIDNTSKEMWVDSCIPNSMKVSILNWCCETFNEPLANDLLSELVNTDKPITNDGLLLLVADTLPRIIPHTLISRRCDVAALLACTIHLLSSNETSSRKAKLLQLLLTLLKKPDAAETRVICEAACLIVKWGGSGEVLSSIAELLGSRSIERRVLASQICVSIAPYVSIELCTSLLLSLVVLMCESNENEVRSLGLKAACLISPIAEHKYQQLESILFSFLKDPVEKHVNDTVQVFVPVFARSAIMSGKFSSDLCRKVMLNLSKSSADKDWKYVLLYMEILKVLVLANLTYVVNVQIVKEYRLSDCDIKGANELEAVPLGRNEECFVDVQCYVCDQSIDVKSLVTSMNCILKENPDVRWGELEWFISLIKQILDISSNSNYLQHASVYDQILTLFSKYIENFGYHFTNTIVKGICTEIILGIEAKLEKLEAVNVENTVVVGVYMATVLPVICDNEELGSFLQKWITYSSIRSLPPKLLSTPLKWLAKHNPPVLEKCLQHIRHLSSSSCESTSGAIIRSFIATVLSELLNNTTVSDNCIETLLLPTVQAFLHDEDVTVREAAVTLWGGVTRACIIQSKANVDQCWESIHRYFDNPNGLGVKETVRAAESLTVLLLPNVDGGSGSNEAELALWALVCRGCLCGAALSALAPALQLSAAPPPHTARRRLEEAVKSPELVQYRDTIEALLHNHHTGIVTSSGTTEHPPGLGTSAPVTPRATNAAQEVGRRVTQMFQHSKTNMNLPNIFKKKS